MKPERSTPVTSSEQTFDLAVLPDSAPGLTETVSLNPYFEDSVNEIRQRWDRLSAYGRKALDEVIQIGELLLKCKENIPHGKWRAWCQEHLPFSERNAQHYMQLTKRSKDLKSAKFADPAAAMRFIRHQNKPQESLSTGGNGTERRSVATAKPVEALSPLSMACLNVQSAMILIASSESECTEVWSRLRGIETAIFDDLLSQQATIHPQIIANHEYIREFAAMA